MKIGVASDSAGDVAALCRAFRMLLDDHKVERLFFLGGDYVDVDGYHESTVEQPLPSTFGGIVEPEVGLGFAMQQALAAMAPPTDPGGGDRVVRVCEKDGPHADETKLFEMLGMQLCLLVHNKGDLTKEDIANAPLILHGKSAKAAVVRIGTRTFITPGSLRAEAPSVALLDLQGNALGVKFLDLDGNVTHTETVPLGGGTKFSAR